MPTIRLNISSYRTSAALVVSSISIIVISAPRSEAYCTRHVMFVQSVSTVVVAC